MMYRLQAFWAAAQFQTISAALSAATAFAIFIITLTNRARLLNWFKSREQLIAERNVAISQTAQLSTQITILKSTQDDLMISNIDLRSRMAKLEGLLPIHEAALHWTPLAIDAFGRGAEMPKLPTILSDYLNGQK